MRTKWPPCKQADPLASTIAWRLELLGPNSCSRLTVRVLREGAALADTMYPDRIVLPDGYVTPVERQVV